MDNVILNKTAIIENCLLRVKEEYVGFENKAHIIKTLQLVCKI